MKRRRHVQAAVDCCYAAPMQRWPLVWLWCVAGCSLNPMTLRPRLLVMSERQEVALGAAASAALVEERGLWPEGELTAYLALLGEQLAAAAPGPAFDYDVQLLDDPSPNAFAFPGGFVFVTRGLVGLLHDEAELAGVLAHEIAHVALQHTAERAAVVWSTELLGSIIGKPVGLFDDAAGQRLADGVRRWMIAPYSRAQEREADRLGAAIAASWGFDPRGLARALARVDAERRATVTAAADDWFASHPSTADRAERIELYATLMERGPAEPLLVDRAEFLAVLDGLALGPSTARGARVGERTLVATGPGLALDLPADWSVEATATGGVAVGPRGAGVLSFARWRAGVPLEVATAGVCAEPALHCVPWPEPVHDGPAVYGELVGPPDSVTRTWWFVAGDDVYQLSGVWPATAHERVAPAVAATLATVRTPTAADRAALIIERLRAVVAEAESLARLVERTGSCWPAPLVAQRNDLSPDAPLAAGEWLVICRAEPWE